MPAPPLSLSLPVPPSSTSLPALPLSVSLPAARRYGRRRPGRRWCWRAGAGEQVVAGRGWVDRVWLNSAAPRSGRLPAGCGRAWPSWSVGMAANRSAAPSARLPALPRSRTTPSALARPPPVAGSMAAKMAVAGRPWVARDAAGDVLPKMLWPLLVAIVPNVASMSLPASATLPATMLLVMSRCAAA